MSDVAVVEDTVAEEMPLHVVSAEDGCAHFGVIVDEVFVSDLFRSVDGQYGVEPEDAYNVSAAFAKGLRDINGLVETAVDAAMDAALKKMVDGLELEVTDANAEGFRTAMGLDASRAELSKALVRFLAADLQSSGMQVTVDL